MDEDEFLDALFTFLDGECVPASLVAARCSRDNQAVEMTLGTGEVFRILAVRVKE